MLDHVGFILTENVIDSQVANAKLRRRFETLLSFGPELLDILLLLQVCA